MHAGNKFSILRAAPLIARSLEVTIRGLPDIKNPPSSLINPFNPQESLSLNFLESRLAKKGQFPLGYLCYGTFRYLQSRIPVRAHVRKPERSVASVAFTLFCQFEI